MKAILCKAYGMPDTLAMDEVNSPVPNPHQLLIAVKACGVNFPDVLIIQGKYQFKPNLPFSPGGEVAGVVEEVGAEVSDFKPGDAVFAPMIFGGFAEKVVIDAKAVMHVPPEMSFTNAAAFTITYATSYHALKDRARLSQGETLLVLGAAGGVGLTAIELGKLMGAKVIAAASTTEKLTLCKQYGADYTINYCRDDLRQTINTITDGKGVNVVFDPVGGAYSDPAFRSISWGGRHLVIGFAAGEIPAIPLNLPLLKGASIMGVFLSSFVSQEPEESYKNLQELMAFFTQGIIKPHIHATYPLEKAAEALNEVVHRKVKGKIVITMD